MSWLRRKPPEIDVRLQQAEREVEDLKRRVKLLETQSSVFMHEAKREIARAV